jgi:hypothetical protein
MLLHLCCLPWGRFENTNTHILAVSRDSLEIHTKPRIPFVLGRDDMECVSGSTCQLTSNLELKTVLS